MSTSWVNVQGEPIDLLEIISKSMEKPQLFNQVVDPNVLRKCKYPSFAFRVTVGVNKFFFYVFWFWSKSIDIGKVYRERNNNRVPILVYLKRYFFTVALLSM